MHNTGPLPEQEGINTVNTTPHMAPQAAEAVLARMRNRKRDFFRVLKLIYLMPGNVQVDRVKIPFWH